MQIQSELAFWRSVIEGGQVIPVEELREILAVENERIVSVLGSAKEVKDMWDFFFHDLRPVRKEIAQLGDLLDKRPVSSRNMAIAHLLGKLSIRVDTMETDLACRLREEVSGHVTA